MFGSSVRLIRRSASRAAKYNFFNFESCAVMKIFNTHAAFFTCCPCVRLIACHYAVGGGVARGGGFAYRYTLSAGQVALTGD